MASEPDSNYFGYGQALVLVPIVLVLALVTFAAIFGAGFVFGGG
jgi:hypothetical protein